MEKLSIIFAAKAFLVTSIGKIGGQEIEIDLRH